MSRRKRYERALQLALVAPILALSHNAAADERAQAGQIQLLGEPDHLLTCPGRVRAVEFSPSGTYLAAGCSAVKPGLDADNRGVVKQGWIGIWSTRDLVEVVPTVELPGQRSVFDIAFSGDGHQVAAAHEGVTIVDVPTGRIARRYDIDAGTRYALALSDDGRLLVDAGAENGVRVIAMESGACMHSFRGGVSPESDPTVSPLERVITSVAISPDNRYVAAADALGTDVWELSTQRHVHRFSGDQGAAWSTAFSHDRPAVLIGAGSTSVFGDAQNPDASVSPWIGVWDVGSKTLIQRLHGPSALIDVTALSADRRLLAMATSFPIGLRVINTTTGEFVATYLTSEQKFATALAISPTGDSVAVGSIDRNVRVWELSR